MAPLDIQRCPFCGAHAFSPVEVERSVQADDGVELAYRVELMKCGTCEELGYTPEQSLDASRARAGALRSHAGFLQPSDIRTIRERLGLTQAALERLMGVSRKTVVRWESGTVSQSRAADGLLRVIRDVPGAFEELAGRAGLLERAVMPAFEVAADWQPAVLATHVLTGWRLPQAFGGDLRVAESPIVTYIETSRVRESFAEVVQADDWRVGLVAANADYALAA